MQKDVYVHWEKLYLVAFDYTFREIILKCDEIKASIFNALLYIITTFLLINTYINHFMVCLGVDEVLSLLSMEARESFVRILQLSYCKGNCIRTIYSLDIVISDRIYSLEFGILVMEDRRILRDSDDCRQDICILCQVISGPIGSRSRIVDEVHFWK